MLMLGKIAGKKRRGWDDYIASKLNGHEFEQTLGDGEGQGTLACYTVHGVPKGWTQLSDWTTAWEKSLFPVMYLFRKKLKVAHSCLTLCNPMDCTVHGILRARILKVGSLSPLQGIFPTQGSNPGLLHCRQIHHQLSHKGSPRLREWVAYPFSSGSSQTRNWTRVSCNAGRFFTSWSIRVKSKLTKKPKVNHNAMTRLTEKVVEMVVSDFRVLVSDC